MKSLFTDSDGDQNRRLTVESYYKMAMDIKYPYKDAERSYYFMTTKGSLAVSCMQEPVLFSLSQFREIIDYYIFFIKNVSDESLIKLGSSHRVVGEDSSMNSVHCMVYYYRFYVKDKKKPWSKKDVMNEVCVENNLTAKEWDINETRNMGRF